MRGRLDENVPVSAVGPLSEAGADVDTVADEGLVGADGPAVLAAAFREGRVVVTLDRGFGDVRAYPPGAHGGIVVLRMDQQAPRRVAGAVRQPVATVELAALAGCVSVWRDGDLRVRCPPGDEGSTWGAPDVATSEVGDVSCRRRGTGRSRRSRDGPSWLWERS